LCGPGPWKSNKKKRRESVMRSIHRQSLWTFAVVLVLALAAHAETIRLIGENVFDVGNEWQYRDTRTEQDGQAVDHVGTFTRKVASDTAVNGLACVLVQEVRDWGTEELYWRLTDSYLQELKWVEGDEYEVFTAGDPTEVIPVWIDSSATNLPFGHGTYAGYDPEGPWNWTGYADTSATYVGSESVTVPAGTFACVVVNIRWEWHDTDGWWGYDEITLWLNETVGIVKEEEYEYEWDPDDNRAETGRSVVELTSTNISGGGSGLAAPTLQSPTGNVTQARPQFMWDAVNDATWYQVYISKQGAWNWDTWVEEATTWTTSDWSFDNGNYEWWVRGWSQADGYGSWSAGMNFTVALTPLAIPTPQPATGTITVPNPTLSWNGVDWATWYEVYVHKQGSWHWSTWVQQATSWSTTAWDFDDGNYLWWVRGWSSTNGNEDWSTSMSFSVADAAVTGITGTWVGLAMDTYSSDGVIMGPDHLIVDFSQSGSSVTMSIAQEDGSLTGTMDGHRFTVSGTDSDGDFTTISAVMSGGNVGGTYEGHSQDSLESWQGTFSVHRPGALADAAGSWSIEAYDRYSSDGLPETENLAMTVSQSGNQITISLDGMVLQGRIEGDTFAAGGHQGVEYTTVNGTVDGNTIQGLYEWDGNDGWGWGQFYGTKQ